MGELGQNNGTISWLIEKAQLLMSGSATVSLIPQTGTPTSMMPNPPRLIWIVVATVSLGAVLIARGLLAGPGLPIFSHPDGLAGG